MKCACIIPCFNEKDRIEDIFYEIEKINKKDIDWFILDNGSIDTSFEIMKNMIKNNQSKNVYIIKKRKNTGYGSGLKYVIEKIILLNNGINNFKINCIFPEIKKSQFYDNIAWTHADGQTPINDVIKAYKIAENNYHNKNILIKGLRTRREDGLLATLFTFFLNLIQIIFYNKKIISPNSQPTLISYELIKKTISYTFDDSLFDTSLSIICAKLESKIIRFPVQFLRRKSGIGANEKIIHKINFSIKNFILLWKMRRYSIIFKKKKRINDLKNSS